MQRTIAPVLAAQYPTIVRTLGLGEPPLMSWLQTSSDDQALHQAFLTTTWKPAREAFQHGALAGGVRVCVDGVNGSGACDQLPPAAVDMHMDNAAEMKAETTAPQYFAALTREEAQQIRAPAH